MTLTELFFSCVCNKDGSTTVPNCSGCDECGCTTAGSQVCMHPMNPNNLKYIKEAVCN